MRCWGGEGSAGPVTESGRGEDFAVAGLVASVGPPARGAEDVEVLDQGVQGGCRERLGGEIREQDFTAPLALRRTGEDPDRGAVGGTVRDSALGEADGGLEEALGEEGAPQAVGLLLRGQRVDQGIGRAEDDGRAVVGQQIGQVLDLLENGERAPCLGRLVGKDTDKDPWIPPVVGRQVLTVGHVQLVLLDAAYEHAAASETGEVLGGFGGEEERANLGVGLRVQGHQEVAAVRVGNGDGEVFGVLVQSGDAGEAGQSRGDGGCGLVHGEVVAAQSAAGLHDPLDGLGGGVGRFDELVGEARESRPGLVVSGEREYLLADVRVLEVDLVGPLQERVPAEIGQGLVQFVPQVDQRRHAVEHRPGGHPSAPRGQGVQSQFGTELAGVGVSPASGQEPFDDSTAVEDRPAALVLDGLRKVGVPAGPGGDDGPLDLRECSDFRVTDPPGHNLRQDGSSRSMGTGHAAQLPPHGCFRHPSRMRHSEHRTQYLRDRSFNFEGLITRVISFARHHAL